MRKYQIFSGRKYIIHRIADCHECDWRSDDYKDKRMGAKCRAHAAKTGHKVSYETGTAITYTAEK